MQILVIEDNLDLAATLLDLLQLNQYQCDHAMSAHRAMQLIKLHPFNLIILDLMLPDMDGLKLCELLRQQGIDTPILMLTARETLQDKLDGFAAGADDYLIKPFQNSEFVARVGALSKRRSGLARHLEVADLVMNLDAKQALRGTKNVELSPTNWKLLEALMRASPNVLSKRLLEQQVWGEDVPDSNSLKVHLHRLRKLVDTQGIPPLLHTIKGHGYCLRSE